MFAVKMSSEDDFETYLKRLQTNRENREKSEDVTNFEVDSLDLLSDNKIHFAHTRQSQGLTEYHFL